MKPIFSGSLTSKAVKQCIKGALLLHATDALILQHVKSKQRARLRLLLIFTAKAREKLCGVSPN